MVPKERELIKRYHEYLVELFETNNPNLSLVKPDKWNIRDSMSCQWIIQTVLSIQEDLNKEN